MAISASSAQSGTVQETPNSRTRRRAVHRVIVATPDKRSAHSMAHAALASDAVPDTPTRHASVRVGINGFGRIGRQVVRIISRTAARTVHCLQWTGKFCDARFERSRVRS